jgi:hypothetical protein
MDGFARSTIAALVYAKQSDLDFHDLAAKLASAMLHTTDTKLQIHTDYEDFVVFDQPDLRICLAHANLTADFPEVAAAQGCSDSIIVSVGDLPNGPSRTDHAEICALLTRQIEAHHPADGEVVLESDVVFTEDTYDMLIEEIVAVLADEAGDVVETPVATVPEDVLILDHAILPEAIRTKRRAAATAKANARPPKSPKQFAPLADDWVPTDLIARYDREVTKREAARHEPRPAEARRRSPGPTLFPTPEPILAAGPTQTRPKTPRAVAAFGALRPQGPHQQPRPTHAPAAADMGGARAMAHGGLMIEASLDGLTIGTGKVAHSIFPSVEEAHAMPLVHRGAIHAVNVAMMAFSLPVGAFLVTLALLGRESLVMSSRATALTGAGMGVAQNDTVLSFLSGLI